MRFGWDFGGNLPIECQAAFCSANGRQQTIIVSLTASEPMAIQVETYSRYQD
jgi:hypothetical protein